jgi:opacity protein-like surface antigen
MKSLALFTLAVIGLASFAADATAQVTKFKAFGALAYVSPLSDSELDLGGVTDAVGASSEFGYNFGIEFRASQMLGIELDYLYAEHDIEGDTAGLLGTTTFKPICATLNFHFPIPALDLYAGPTIGYVNWGDFEAEDGTNQAIDPEFAFGVSAGAEFPIFPKISLMGGLRWLDVKAQEDGSDEEIDVNPLFARFGGAFHF